MDSTSRRAATRYDYIKNKNMKNNTNQTTGPYHANTPSIWDALAKQMEQRHKMCQVLAAEPVSLYGKTIDTLPEEKSLK